jgi:hypothetical protein
MRSDECLFFDAGDVQALARLIDDIAEQPHRLHAYRERLPAARARLSWAGEKTKYVGMLRELAARSPVRAFEVGTAPPR